MSARPGALVVGRSFGPPAFDLLVIAGGLTFPLALWLLLSGATAAAAIGVSLPVVVLLANQAHFAASTVRLYSKPGAFESLPFLTMGLPLVTLAVLALAIVHADDLGRHLWALSVSWSPFHYAAQTFGLASMYCYRSGCSLSPGERRALRGACLLPFAKAFLGGTGAGYGLGWLLPSAASAIAGDPALAALFQGLVRLLDFGIFLAPLALFGWLLFRARRSGTAAMPLLSLVVILANGTWFVLFDALSAFVWATVLHGLQYLAIVAIFHSQDRLRQPGNRHGPAFHMASFYAICVLLGYGLFQCWPYAFQLAGAGVADSMLMVIGVINIHHFVVDAFIWRLRRDRNYRTVMATASASA